MPFKELMQWARENEVAVATYWDDIPKNPRYIIKLYRHEAIVSFGFSEQELHSDTFELDLKALLSDNLEKLNRRDKKWQKA